MVRLNRRDVVASLAAAATLLANRAHAACEVWPDQISGVPTKSYQCDVPGGQVLTTTFMRLSDVMFDSAAKDRVPDWLGDYHSLVQGHQLVDTPVMRVFTALFDKHAFAFESRGAMGVQLDLRQSGSSGGTSNWDQNGDVRWRTLGVWDNNSDEVGPIGENPFPLPSELRRAMGTPYQDSTTTFLRFATQSDFAKLDAKITEYMALWDAHPETGANDGGFVRSFGNIRMLADIDAGSVPGFVPLLFTPFLPPGCGGADGGPSYIQPALYVDVAVCRNDGNAPVTIQDVFGAVDDTSRLRPYMSETPPQVVRFDWQPVTLAPGESLLIVQRLLFGAQPAKLNGWNEKRTVFKRAVYGPTHLPRGVIVDGEMVFFEGRSHNTVILASYADCCSCPYLESWCPKAGEWIDHGKILTACDGADKAGSETCGFFDLRTRFRLTEREHEETFLSGASLTLTLRDGSTHRLVHPEAQRQFSIGESCELDFELPREIAAETVHSELTLSGHYEKFGQPRFEAQAAALAASSAPTTAG